MKNTYIKILGLSLLILGSILSSCEDYLDRDPLSVVSEAIYFQTADQFVTAENNFYPTLGFPDGDDGTDLSNNQTSDNASYGRGNTVSLVQDDIWEDTYGDLRAVNQLLQKSEEYAGDLSEIETSVGAAYFFRAWHHYILLKRFGGVPILTVAPEPGDDILFAPRNSRYEVVHQILSDLNEAISLLPSNQELSSNDLGKLNIEAARAFKARVLLYEATWEKYVGSATDGDGTTVGAGSAMPEGYLSINEMLTSAKEEALIVMESGHYELWNQFASIGEGHLWYLFNLEDGSNPAGLSKGDNKEFILQSIYDFNFRGTGSNRSHSKKFGPSRKMMDMFLCTDGLPVQFSSDFQGYATVTSEFENRDHRVHINSMTPLREYWGRGAAVDGGGAQYGVDFADAGTDFDYRYIPNLSTLADRNNGYQGRKFVTEHILREGGDEGYNYPIIRLAEVLLIYAESTVELGDGVISQEDLDISINLIRARSGVAPLTDVLIAPYPELTMFGEIRRERAIELFGENFRYDDLKRWNIAAEELNSNICVNYVAGTEWETIIDPKSSNPIYNPSAFSNGLTTSEEVVSSYAGIATTGPGAVIIDGAGSRNFQLMNYVDAIPTGQIMLNPSLTQNPGW